MKPLLNVGSTGCYVPVWSVKTTKISVTLLNRLALALDKVTQPTKCTFLCMRYYGCISNSKCFILWTIEQSYIEHKLTKRISTQFCQACLLDKKWNTNGIGHTLAARYPLWLLLGLNTYRSFHHCEVLEMAEQILFLSVNCQLHQSNALAVNLSWMVTLTS